MVPKAVGTKSDGAADLHAAKAALNTTPSPPAGPNPYHRDPASCAESLVVPDVLGTPDAASLEASLQASIAGIPDEMDPRMRTLLLDMARLLMARKDDSSVRDLRAEILRGETATAKRLSSIEVRYREEITKTQRECGRMFKEQGDVLTSLRAAHIKSHDPTSARLDNLGQHSLLRRWKRACGYVYCSTCRSRTYNGQEP